MRFDSKTLQQFIDDHEIAAEIIRLDNPTLTVADAAGVLGVQPDQVIKTVLFLANGEPVLVVSCGVARIAWKQLADYLGVSRRRLKSGRARQVREITGYEVGAVPPFAHPQPLRTIVETAVLEQPVVYGGGGEVNTLMRITTAELRRVVGSETAVLAERSE